MVFVAITPAGLADALCRAADGDAIWCGSDTISAHEYRSLTRPAVSRFNDSLLGPQATERAVATIEEHHPDQNNMDGDRDSFVSQPSGWLGRPPMTVAVT